jgi:hypothetical protein
MPVPNIFGTATAAIPLSQLDQNFATAITLGNTAVYLGNTTTSLGNVTLTNVTISSGTSNIAANVSTAVGLLPEAQGGTGTTTGYYGFKNRLINGSMVIDQRNAGASVAVTASAPFTVDRWRSFGSQSSKLTVQQTPSATETGYANRVGAGFTSYLACTSQSAYTVGSSEYFNILQSIEGLNISDLAWGTANAKTITISFWAYSSLTGTFGGAINNSAINRSYPFTYTISSADTWEQKSITIAGDTSGTWLTTNGVGMHVRFGLGAGATLSGTAGAWSGSAYVSATGATSVVGTNGATFYITGVQLEKGSTATSFDYRPYGTELQLCQRYAYPIRGGLSGFGNGTTVVDAAVNFPVEMRSVPTVTQGTLVYQAYGTGTAYTQSSNLNSLPTSYTQNGGTLRFSNFTGLTSNSAYILVANATSSAVTTYACILTSEL